MVVRLAVYLFAVLLLAGGAGVASAAEYQQVVIENAAIRAVISTQRASIDRLELKDNHSIRLPKHLQRDDGGTDPTAPLAVLAPFAVRDTPTSKENASNQHGWLVNDGPTARRWGLSGKEFAPWTVEVSTPMSATFTTSGRDGLAYRVTWTVDAVLPRISATIALTNGGTAELHLNPSIVPINGIHQDYAPNEVAYLTAFSHHGGSESGNIEKYAIPAPGAAIQVMTENGTGVDFVGLKSRFFAVWWTPGSMTLDGAGAAPASTEPVGAVGPGMQAAGGPIAGNTANWRADVGGYATQLHADHQGYLQITYSPVDLLPGRTLTSTWSLTASSMARSDLKVFGLAEHRIDLTDWMHRTFIIFTKPLVFILDLLVQLVSNYAVAVILLTFLVKAALFKLTWKQHASMAAMQKVAPDLKYIQEQYKNDKTQLAQKQMELYKKHGVNPLGGCLPLLIQMPIFIGLYNAFQYNADMRGEHFLWISDLTLPDQIWGMPLAFLHGWVLSLNPLPLVYIAVTIWMSLSSPLPTGVDPQQEQIAKSMRWMPVLFGLIFYNMPAGLVLYFTVNAILSTIEVKFIRARLAATAAAKR